MYNEDILNLQFQEFNGKLCRATEYFSLVLKADNKFNPKFWRGHILCNHIYIITYTHSEWNTYIERNGIFQNLDINIKY